MYFSKSPVPVPPHVSVSGTLLWLPATTAMHYFFGERVLKPIGIKPHVDTSLELNQKLSLMLELESFSLKSVFFRIGKISTHTVVTARKVLCISQCSGRYFKSEQNFYFY